jgi:hypothetical protein
MKIVDKNNICYMDTYREDYDELLRLMQIPDIRKIIFRRLAIIKDQYREVIKSFNFREPGHWVRDGEIIPLKPAERHYDTVDPLLQEYIDFLYKDSEYRDMTLEEYDILLKPLKVVG